MTGQQLIELEIKIAHQENVIETLQELVYEQHKRLERLEGQLERLSRRFEGDAGPDIGPGNDKPPHY